MEEYGYLEILMGLQTALQKLKDSSSVCVHQDQLHLQDASGKDPPLSAGLIPAQLLLFSTCHHPEVHLPSWQSEARAFVMHFFPSVMAQLLIFHIGRRRLPAVGTHPFSSMKLIFERYYK